MCGHGSPFEVLGSGGCSSWRSSLRWMYHRVVLDLWRIGLSGETHLRFIQCHRACFAVAYVHVCGVLLEHVLHLVVCILLAVSVAWLHACPTSLSHSAACFAGKHFLCMQLPSAWRSLRGLRLCCMPGPF
jgi:hypothetical protein